MTTILAKNSQTAYVQTSLFLYEQSDQGFAMFYSNSTFYTPHKKLKKKKKKLAQTLKKHI